MRSGLVEVLGAVESEMRSHETDVVEYIARRGQAPDLGVYRQKEEYIRRADEIRDALSRHADTHREFAIALLDGERLLARREAEQLQFVPAMEGFAAERLVEAKQKVGDSAVGMASLLVEEPGCWDRPGRRKRFGTSCLTGLVTIGLGFGVSACTGLVFAPLAGLPGALGILVALVFLVGAIFQWNPWDGWYGFRGRGRFAYWMTHSVEADGLGVVPVAALRAAVADDSGAAGLAAAAPFGDYQDTKVPEAPAVATEQDTAIQEEEHVEQSDGNEQDARSPDEDGGGSGIGEGQAGAGDDGSSDVADAAF